MRFILFSINGIDLPLDEPITIGGQERKRLGVQMYNFDPSLAPAGKTVVRVMLASDYGYWKKLQQDLERYKAEKEQITDQVVISGRNVAQIICKRDKRPFVTATP